jgi:hypothetical protein
MLVGRATVAHLDTSREGRRGPTRFLGEETTPGPIIVLSASEHFLSPVGIGRLRYAGHKPEAVELFREGGCFLLVFPRFQDKRCSRDKQIKVFHS